MIRKHSLVVLWAMFASAFAGLACESLAVSVGVFFFCAFLCDLISEAVRYLKRDIE